MSEFSARLQERIANSQFGVSAVAKLAGISRQTIYNLLQPDFDPINPSVRKVARALGVDPLELIPDKTMSPNQPQRLWIFFVQRLTARNHGLSRYYRRY